MQSTESDEQPKIIQNNNTTTKSISVKPPSLENASAEPSLDRRLRYYRPYTLSLIFILFGAAQITYNSFNAGSFELYGGSPLSSRYGVLSIIIGVFLGIFVKADHLVKRASQKGEEEREERRKKTESILNKAPSEVNSGQSTYFDSLVKINIDNLGDYYQLVRNHANKSFLASVGVGIAGFILIAAGLGLGFINNSNSNTNSQTLTYISTGSGIIIEFISSVFFYLYNRTVRQMKEYHDSLLDVQNILLSFKLVGDNKNESEKAQMLGQMLVFLIGKQKGETISANKP